MSSASVDMDKIEFTEEEEFEHMQKARNSLVWIATFSIVMFFAGLTSAYLVSSADNFWVVMDLPTSFWISTLIIVVSSVPMYFALKAARAGNKARLTGMLGLTLILGLGFTATQMLGYQEYMATNSFFTGSENLVGKVNAEYGADYTIIKGGETLVLEDGEFFLPSDRARSRPLNETLNTKKNGASSYFYAMTALHWIHLFGGMVMLIFLLILAARGRYTDGKWHVIRRGGIYWHFLGVLWVYLFLFLQYIH